MEIVKGHIADIRDFGKLKFLIVRQDGNLIQIVLKKEVVDDELFEKVKGLTKESVVEILGEIEREGIVSVDEWKELRVIRNSLSHDYPEELAEITIAINEILEKIDFFETIIKKIQKLCSQKKK